MRASSHSPPDASMEFDTITTPVFGHKVTLKLLQIEDGKDSTTPKENMELFY